MKVNTEHRRVRELKEWWARVRACGIGPRAIKALGRTILPALRSHDSDPQNGSAAYEAYKGRAVFNPVVSRTIKAFVGLVFRKAPEVQIPEQYKPLLADVTGTGVPFQQFAAERFHDLLSPGRTGILTDLPKPLRTTDGEEIEDEGARPFWSDYCAEAIVSWRYEAIADFTKRCIGTQSSAWRKVRAMHGAKVLTTVVLREVREVVDPNDRFVTKEEVWFREVILGDVEVNGVVTIGQHHQMWEPKRTTDGATIENEWQMSGAPLVPTRRKEPIPFIPFEPCNPESLTMEPDEPPLLGMSELNISQYRTSADLENGRFKVGHPQLYLFGLSTDEDLYVGDKVWTSTNHEAKAGVVQVESAFEALERAMVEKDEQMQAEGARLLTKNDGQPETATATKIKKAGERSLLARMADSLSIALTRSLLHMIWWHSGSADFEELTSKVLVKLNTDFEDEFLTGADAEAWLRVQIGGGISRDTLLRMYARYEVLPDGRTVEDEQRLIQKDQAAAAALLGDTTEPEKLAA